METMMSWLPTVGYGFLGGLVVWFGPRAYTFLRAITSGWDKDNVASRLAICKECPRVKQRDYVDPEGGLTSFLYCDECKCGSHHIAELNTKLGFNNLACPMGKWGPASGMTVHEAHDILIDRGKKERAVDKRERENMMAGRDRDYVGPLNDAMNAALANASPGPVQLGNNGVQTGNRTAKAQAQLQPTAEASEEQRTRIQQAREARAALQKQSRIETDERAAKHAAQTNKIWGDRETANTATATAADEATNNAAPLVGTDHEGQILVDQKEQSDGGHSLDERIGD